MVNLVSLSFGDKVPFAGVLDCDPILGWMINGSCII
jgi:hypothetical protein